jgi:hypothetical protein
MGNWDNQIDDVARQMTEGGPGGSFTARVLTRIDTRDPQPWVRRVVWRWSPVVVAVATALALVIALARWNTGTVRLKPDTTDGRTPRRASWRGLRPLRRTSERMSQKRPPIDRTSVRLQPTRTDRPARAEPVPQPGVPGRRRGLRRAPITERSNRRRFCRPLGVDAMETTAAIVVLGFAVSPSRCRRWRLRCSTCRRLEISTAKGESDDRSCLALPCRSLVCG